MTVYKDGAKSSHPYKEPASLPDSIPKVQELGTTSAPLKSAAFFLGAYCKEYNGLSHSTCSLCLGTDANDCWYMW